MRFISLDKKVAQIEMSIYGMNQNNKSSQLLWDYYIINIQIITKLLILFRKYFIH